MSNTLRDEALVLWVAALLTLYPRAAFPQQLPTSHVPTASRRAEEFGTNDYTVIVIPAESFTADGRTGTYGILARDLVDDGGNPVTGHLYSGVVIPAGLVVDFIGLQAVDVVGGASTATLFSVDRYSGTTSGVISVTSTAHPAPENIGTDYNASPLGFQWTENAHNALVLDVNITNAATGALGWVEIWFKRTVSPPPITPSFTDVATDDPGYPYIEALKASGITAGCTATTFCPDATLTRRQMAVFLSKALGLHWPY